MELEFNELKEEFIDALNKTKTLVLATCSDNIVTARPMSIINVGTDIYFQTSKIFTKYKQIMNNKNVALCFSNISIEGIAEDIGSWSKKINNELLKIYLEQHKNSFDRYGSLKNQVVIKVSSVKVTFWKYIDDKPYRDYLYILDEKAERHEYIDE